MAPKSRRLTTLARDERKGSVQRPLNSEKVAGRRSRDCFERRSSYKDLRLVDLIRIECQRLNDLRGARERERPKKNARVCLFRNPTRGKFALDVAALAPPLNKVRKIVSPGIKRPR